MLSIASFCVFFIGCASSIVEKTEEYPEWIVYGESMDRLRGIVLRPWPEVPSSELYYSERKPHEVNYLYESGAVRVVCYDMDRRVLSDKFWEPGQLIFLPEEVRTIQQWKERLGFAIASN